MRKSKPIGGIGSERKKKSARNSICLVWDLFEQQARRFRRVFQRRSHLPSDQRELIEIWDLVSASPSLLPPPPSSPSSLHPRGCRFSIFFLFFAFSHSLCLFLLFILLWSLYSSVFRELRDDSEKQHETIPTLNNHFVRILLLWWLPVINK